MRELGILGAIQIVQAIVRSAVDELAVCNLSWRNQLVLATSSITNKFLSFSTDAEALQVVFDPSAVSYKSLLEFFYRMHDPTTLNRQGMDSGTQYRSGIFYHSPEQKAEAEEITKKVNEQWYNGKVSTQVIEAGKWWDAEDYHQEYLHHNPGGYECPAHYVRQKPELK